MPDDKTTKAPETAAPDTGPGKTPEQAPVKEPVKTEPPMPEQKPPEQDADKAAPPKDNIKTLFYRKDFIHISDVLLK